MLFSLPDVIWFELLKLLTIQDQFRLKRVCKQGAEKMRHLTSGVTTLVISTWADREEVKSAVNELSLASVPSMQLALSAGDDKFELFADYPATAAHPSMWAYLMLRNNQLFNSDTIEAIVDTFPAVTDLKFFGYGNASCKNLTALLKHHKWRNQLTNLMIHCFYLENFSDDTTIVGQMISAVNSLSELKSLAMNWDGTAQLPVELSILSRLETVIFETFSASNRAVLPSLIRHAIGNDNLNVIISPGKKQEWFTFLNNPLSRRIIRFLPKLSGLSLKDNLHMLCKQLSFLTSIRVQIDGEEQLEPVFTALAQLPRLVHLELDISIWKKYSHFGRFLKPLPSVRALNIILIKNWHSNLSWMDLAHTLPNLKTIHVYDFNCEECDVSYWSRNNGSVQEYSEDTTPSLTIANNCFRTTLGQLHNNVPHDRIILGKQTPHRTLQQQLAPNVRQ